MSIITEIAYQIALNSDLETLGNLYFTNKQFREIIEDPYFREQYLTPEKLKEINDLYFFDYDKLTRNQIVAISKLHPNISSILNIIVRIFEIDDPILLEIFVKEYLDAFNYIVETNINNYDVEFNHRLQILGSNNNTTQEQLDKMVEEIKEDLRLELIVKKAVRTNSANILRKLLPTMKNIPYLYTEIYTSHPPHKIIETLKLLSKYKQLDIYAIISILEALAPRDIKIDPNFIDFIINKLYELEDVTSEQVDEIIKILRKYHQTHLFTRFLIWS